MRRIATEGADLADDVGLGAVTISEVARRLGVRVPSLYAHVAGTEELLLRIAEVSLHDLADQTAHAVLGRSGGDALQGYADALRDFARAHPGRYDATRHRVLGDSEAAADVIAAGRRHADLMAAVLRGFALDGDDVVHATRWVGATLHGFVALELSGAFDHSMPPAEESWRRILSDLGGTLGA